MHASSRVGRNAGAGTLTGFLGLGVDELLISSELLGVLEPRVAAEVVALVSLDRVPVGVRKVHKPRFIVNQHVLSARASDQARPGQRGKASELEPAEREP